MPFLFWPKNPALRSVRRFGALGRGRQPTLAFQVDLFSARGSVSANLSEVAERRKGIQYSSRTRMGIESFRQAHSMHQHIASLLERLPETPRDDPAARFLRRHGGRRGTAARGCAVSM